MSAEDSLSRIQLLLRDKQQRSSFQDTQFAQGDANGDGLLQRDELRSAVATVCSDLGTSLPSSEKIDLLFAACDTNHDGGLSPDEFRTFVGHVLRAAAKHLEGEIVALQERLAAERAAAQEKLAKELATPTHAEGTITVCEVDSRGMAVLWEMTCTACGKQWGGMGGGLPQGVQKCDGCGVRAVVVAKGYAIPAARVSARDRKKEKKGGRR